MAKKTANYIIRRFFIIAFSFLLCIPLNAQTDDQYQTAEDLNRSSVGLIDTDISGALDTNLAAWQLSKSIKNDTLTALIYSARGIIYTNLPSFDSAYFYIRKALFLRTKSKDIEGIGKSYTNLGTMFYESEQYEQSIFYHKKSLEIKKDLNDVERLPGAYNNIGNCFHAFGNIDSAIYYYQKGISITEGSPGNIIDNKINLSNMFIELGRTEQALALLKELAPELDTSLDKGTCYHQIGIAFENLEMYDSAQFYYNQTRGLTKVLENLTLENDLQRSQITLNLKRENDTSGLRKFLEYVRLNDSINAQKLSSKIAEAEAKYNYDHANSQLIIEEEKTKRVQAENDEKYWIIITLLGLLAIIIFLVIFISRFFAQKRRIARLELDQNKQEIARLMHGYELDLFEAQNFGQQEERQRIASDLHDRLGGLLAAVNLQVESLKYKPINDQEEEIAKVKAMVSDGISEVRNVAHNMRAEALKKHGLKGALEAISQSINASKKLKIDLYLEDLNDTSGSELEREVYKIIMELISNTLRHAKANSITLQINEIDHELTIVFEDDGVGFSYSESQKSGLGMDNIKKRVKKLYGNLLIDSQPGSGTTIIIKIPRT